MQIGAEILKKWAFQCEGGLDFDFASDKPSC